MTTRTDNACIQLAVQSSSWKTKFQVQVVMVVNVIQKIKQKLTLPTYETATDCWHNLNETNTIKIFQTDFEIAVIYILRPVLSQFLFFISLLIHTFVAKLLLNIV